MWKIVEFLLLGSRLQELFPILENSSGLSWSDLVEGTGSYDRKRIGTIQHCIVTRYSFLLVRLRTRTVLSSVTTRRVVYSTGGV